MRPLLTALLLIAVLLAVAAEKETARSPLAEADIKTLKEAGVESTDEGLLKYLRGLNPTPQLRREIEALIARLGSSRFEEREDAGRRLAALIRFARPEIQRACRSTDREVARRAKALLTENAGDADEADRRQETVLAAMREVARRKTPGAVPALLEALPLCERPDLRKAAGQALTASARPADADALGQALGSPDPHVRIAAVAASDAVLGEKAREELARLLDDRDEGVRLATALALLNRADRRALPVLGRLLDSPDLAIRNRAGHVLRAVTEKDTCFVAYAAPELRAKAAAEWRRWIEEHGRTARRTLPAPATSRLGKVLMCSIGLIKGRVVEYEEQGKKLWEVEFPSPTCCEGLPDGHRLVGHRDGRVKEYDAEGRPVWGLGGLAEPVTAVRRLHSGRTLVALGEGERSMIKEFRPDGTVGRCVTLSGDHAMDLQPLENGNTLAALFTSGRVVEFDRQGKVVWEVRGFTRPSSVQRLEKGTTLVCSYGSDKVVEVDRSGKVVWSHQIIRPGYAQGLPNGHTLILTIQPYRFIKIDAAGKVLAEYAEDYFFHLSAY